MQISITKDKYSGHAKSPWLVVLPARLSPTGKRKYRRFATRAAAASYVATIRGHVKQHGEKPVAMLPARLAADAAAACQLLEGTGMTLCDAVRQLLATVHAQGVACAPFIPSGGAGAGVGVGDAAAAAAALTLPGILAKVEDAKSQHQSTVTLRARRVSIGTLLNRNPGLADMPITAITQDIMQRALDTAWPHAPQTWNCARRHVHALFAYAIRRRWVRMENPVTPIDLQPVREAEITALPPSDLKKLFDAARPATPIERAAAKHITDRNTITALIGDFTDLRAYIAVCAFAGMRPTECSRLRWQDIDFEDAIISVRAANSKTGGQRHIEMHPTLRAWLLACRPANAAPTDLVTPSESLATRLRALRHRAGLGDSWQNDCLRHSYATYYLKARCGEIHRLQLNMGHRSAQLLYSRYVNMAGTTRDMAEKWWQILPE